MELQTGAVFAGYRIEGFAGQGAMGVVYRASQIALERQVALKLIVPELADDSSFRERFKRESQLGALIEHPNVLPVYEAGEAEGLLFISMRWVEGTDLRSLIISEGGLELGRAVAIVEQIGAALDAAHRHGLVHRDVKPANVLIDPEAGEHAYLTDFGLTKRTTTAGGLTRTGHFVGTPDYMPPEQIRGERVDARADVYSLGCMMFHSLTGHVPYERDSEVAKIYAHLTDPPPSVAEHAPEAPPPLDTVVTKALAKAPDDRYPSAGDLARAARAALTEAVPPEREHSVATGAAAPPAPTVPAAAGPTVPAPVPGTTIQTPASAPTAPAAAGAAAAETVPAPSPPARDAGAVAPAAPAPRAPAPPAPPASPPVAHAPPARRRRGAVLVALLVVGLVGGALALAGVYGGSEDKQAASESGGGGGDQALPADEPADEPAETPAAPSVVATIPAGDGPDGLAVDGDTVWVANARANALTRIDATTNRPVGDPVQVGRNPDGVAAADGVVWVTNTDDGTVTRIEGGASVTVSVGAQPEGIALGDRVAWVANSADGTVQRLDRDSAEAVGAPIQVGSRPIGVFVGEAGVWVANSGSRTITLIDPATAQVVGDPIPVGKNARGVAEGLGYLWVSNTDDDSVTRIDPASRQPVGGPIRVGDRPKEIAFAAGLVWVVNEYSNTLSRISPKTGRPAGAPIAVGKAPLGLAAGAGALWVSNFEADTVSRVRP